MTFVIFCITASSSKTWLQFQAQNETCIVECLTTLDGDLCKSVCGDNITLYEDYQDALQEDEEEKSIIEANKAEELAREIRRQAKGAAKSPSGAPQSQTQFQVSE